MLKQLDYLPSFSLSHPTYNFFCHIDTNPSLTIFTDHEKAGNESSICYRYGKCNCQVSNVALHAFYKWCIFQLNTPVHKTIKNYSIHTY